MSTSNCLAALFIATIPLMGIEPNRLSDRVQNGELQHTFSASRDGFLLVQKLGEKALPSDLVFASITEPKQSLPPYLAGDPKYNTTPPKRPQLTNFKIKVNRSTTSAISVVPDSINWDELVPAGAWAGPHITAYQGLTEAGFDPFAHAGEVAFQFDVSKQGREQFADLLIVPDGWGAQIASASVWRIENNRLFASSLLAKEQIASLRTASQSENPLVKKLSVMLLMRHNAATVEDMKAWLRSEPSLIDCAVTVQLMLAQDARNSVVTASAWMVAEGERIWGGALVGATLLFAENETAVTSMMRYHTKLHGLNGVQSDEANSLKESAKNQIGFDTIEAIGAELIKTNVIRKYPMFSAANQMLSATNVVDRASLFFEASAPGK